MPLFALPFPAFDPVLVRLGPLAVRWYALAYIAGILLGWIYARAIIRSEQPWGGPAPMTTRDYDDFILWVTLGIIVGGRIGYVAFYNPAYFAANPSEIVQLWKGGMSFHGGFLGCVLAVILFALYRGIPMLSLGDITCAAGPIGLFFGRVANFINGELWGRPTDVSWAFVFPAGGPTPRHPSQLYEAVLEGLVLFAVLALMIRAGALEAAGPDHRGVRRRLCGGALVLRIVSRTRPAAWLSLGRSHHGHAAVAAVAARRPCLHCHCAAARTIAANVMSEMTPLEAEIRRLIAIAGPMPLAQYMTLCLTIRRTATT